MTTTPPEMSMTMSANTSAGLLSPTLGLRTSTTLKFVSGNPIRAHPRKTTSSSSFLQPKRNVGVHGSCCTLPIDSCNKCHHPAVLKTVVGGQLLHF